MMAAELIQEARTAGVSLIPLSNGRLQVIGRPQVPAELKARLSTHKAEIVALLQACATLEALYRRWWRTPETESMTTFLSLSQEIGILEQQVGEDTAWRTLEAAARRWYQETGAWPRCKLPGIPETERDAIPELGLDLEAFEREGRPLEIKTPWLVDPLWFVPGQAEAEALVKEGVHRGRIWTAQELRDLLAIPGMTQEQVRKIATAKAIFEGTVTA